MAFYQGKHGKRGSQAYNPCEAGTLVASLFEMDLTTQGLLANDVVEMGVLPARAFVTDVIVMGVNAGAVTAEVGLLTGEAGNLDPARTLVGGASTVIAAGSLNNAEAPATARACASIPESGSHRAWGLIVSGNIAAGAGKKIMLAVKYRY